MDDVSRLPYRGALRGKKTTSELVLVRNLSDLGPPSVSASDTGAKANVTPLPVVQKEEINFQ